MGVPKFYRWISERYPCLSEVVKEFQLPEFDNLYLDMNGIIHVCSHPDDENPHFRITEEKIFQDICHYIDFLFRMIKPRRVFFMAVDGCAPRAKMNQQRGRRFRSAREAELLIQKAVEKGETLPTEKRFDSNCITPGTPFMVRLQEHLKYFVVDKITNDPLWQGPKVYLSGHETPGEGEHKVMDYIRYSKSQAGYDPDTRHCLYGLDADLIMLGLASHEPHFSLLREEVRFGGKKDRGKRPVTPEETTFHLLHLSLLRDYLAYEFYDLKGQLPFPWDLEGIIDDWILMGFLVGNDFIPHLPHLHIHHDALPLLWRTYKSVLPILDGYLNEGGHLNLERFEKFFEELSKFDTETFESAFSDLRYLESKLGGKSINESVGKGKPKMKELKPFKVKENGNPFCALEDESATTSAGLDGDDLRQAAADEDSDDVSDDDEDEDDDLDGELGEESEDNYSTFDDEFQLHKRDYYMSKMKYSEVSSDVLQDQANGYVVAIQWILLYYFEGCPSWSWYYPHHYAPYISDVKGFSKMKIQFELSKPFLPFQQLMAVLPAASKDLLPPALQPLMTEAGSPVLDFYPVNFETDLNGKQQDWEAVVLIPFIDEQRLLSAMEAKEPLMTGDEKARNIHGPHMMYQYTPDNQGFYPSSLPGVFPDIHCSRAKVTELDKHLFCIDSKKLKKGLLEGVRLHVYFPGFPTLRHLPHTHDLSKVGVKVFQHNSRGESMALRVQCKEGLRLEEVADELLGKTTHVGWPHLHEARVMAVANESYRIQLVEDGSKKGKTEAVLSFERLKLGQNESTIVAREASSIKDRHMDRFAIDVGDTEIVIYACPMTGRTYSYGLQGAITLEKQFAAREVPFLHQMTVKDIEVEESGHTTFKTLEEVFPVASDVFMVGNPHYGAQGEVKEILTESCRIRINLNNKPEPDFRQIGSAGLVDRYLPSYIAAQQLGVENQVIARITGSVFVERSSPKGGKVNIGLNLKFTKRCEEVPGYTKKEDDGWRYSSKCIKTVEEYISHFPDLWLQVQKQRSGNDFYTEDALFPEGCETKLDDVVKFLEQLPCTKAPRMKFGSEILDEERVKEIEEMTAQLNPVGHIVKMKVKPRLLFRPLANQGSLVPDPDTDFLLYDRVVVVKAGYSVPFGKRGTIIGIPNEEEGGITPHSLYDVVFDSAFPGGITLRCSPNKGYRVPGSAMLNITFGEFRKNRPEPTGVKNSRRPRQNTTHSYSGAANSGNGFSYNNNNTAGMRPLYNDRAGMYSEKANMWRRQQQQFRPHQPQAQQQVKWDSKGQPLFGQVFHSQNQQDKDGIPSHTTAQPQFVTPKVKGQVSSTVITNRSINQDNRGRNESSEFDNLWKNLQSHQNSKQGSKPSETALDQTSALRQLVLPSGQQQQQPTQRQQQSPRSQEGQNNMSYQTLVSQSIQPTQILSKPQTQPAQPSAGTSSSQPHINILGKQPRSVTQQDPGATPAIVQSLFEKAKATPEVSAAPENAEFLAMFNSLKTQKDDGGRGAGGNQGLPTTGPTSKSQADMALKQLLKIGVQSSSHPAPVTPSSPSSNHGQDQAGAMRASLSPSSKPSTTAYGRQVSLHELFEEANRQQQKQQAVETPPQRQQQHVSQMPPPSVGGARQESKGHDSRDPIADLEKYCQTNYNQSSLQFEYKLQPEQNSYIAIVILPYGHRYEGSLCKTKEEASKSAASIALLCLNSKPNSNHSLMSGYMPGIPRPQVNRFFSTNSAFSPIGLPGPNPALLPCHPAVSAPMLLTPQHFINQPPPSLPLHQLFQQQQKQQQHQSQQQQLQQMLQHNPHTQNYGREHQQSSQAHSPRSPQAPANQMPGSVLASQSSGQQAAAPTMASQGSVSGGASAASVSQQFIPLQVSRNQKAPSRRKDSESEKPDSSTVSNTSSHVSKDLMPDLQTLSTGEEVPTNIDQLDSASGSDKKEQLSQTKDKNGVLPTLTSAPAPFSPAPTTSSGVSSAVTSKASTPTAKSGIKKKSRLAANFGGKK